MSAPRVALIGARRVRQGLGPFVARDLRAAGAEVPCFLVTRPESIEAAARGLREVAGLEARGFVDLDELIARETPDALAILSPAETHAGILEQAAAARLHVLCEKPFIWGETRATARCREILAAFEAGRRLVWENCQWPYALPAFEALHPGGLDGPPGRFEMELQPASRGLQSLADALPHPLSLLQALSPGEPEIRDVWFSTLSEHAESMSLGFVYEAGGRDTAVEIKLSSSETAPRRAAFCIDGRRAERLVSGADYQLSLATADRSVPLADPLTQLVADFVETLRSASDEVRNPRAREIAQRMHLLMEVVSAYSREARP
ncbi:MAG: Gfo/Idh/MocA family oxidoreductase [Myxococcota bacterium]